MDLLILSLVLPFLSVQGKPSQEDIRALVGKLRSGSVDEREEAVGKLKELGKAATSELKNVSPFSLQ